ncbi:MAG: c-type cytochrome biogenesis protein CcmI [Paracoccaceae bacterium]|nr:c-type cytochrome biogenesis protein CcmI [Paracoccaceae bacterium]
MGFWIAASGMTIAVTLLLILTLRRGGAGEEPTAAYDLRVYRDQLKEITRDESRGTIGADEAERLRTEVARRVLEADRALSGAETEVRAPKTVTWVAAGLMVVLGAGSLWLYQRIGAPGYNDVPISLRMAEARKMRADRPSQAAIEARIAASPDLTGVDAKTLDLIAKLRKAVAAHPDDLKGQQFLAEYEARLANYTPAAAAERKVVALKGANAAAEDYAALADLDVRAAQGVMGPEAQDAVKKALTLDAGNKLAAAYAALEEAQKAATAAPNDLTAQGTLAQRAAALGLYPAAWRAQAEVVRVLGPKVQAKDYSALAGLMILAANNEVSPEADKALAQALKLDPKDGAARFYTGLMFGETGRPDLAFELWQPLLDGSKPTDAWVDPIRSQIQQLAAAAGINYTLPPVAGGAGPTAGDITAAQGMSAGDRQQMIKGMVAQLAERLATQGGSPAEWAKLINAYGVLGETDKARAFWTKAQAVFAGHDADLAPVKAAAQKVGVAG